MENYKYLQENIASW